MNHRDRIAAANAKRDLPLIELRAESDQVPADPELVALELVYADLIRPDQRAAAQGD
jgi:hypothetical protein